MFAFTKNFVFLQREKSGGLAHLVERKVRNLKVAGSSPVTSTIIENQQFASICLEKTAQIWRTNFNDVLQPFSDETDEKGEKKCH